MSKPVLSTRPFNVSVAYPPKGNFKDGAQYIAIAGLYEVNNSKEPALGEYTERAPEKDTYVLGSINGKIQWIKTEECD